MRGDFLAPQQRIPGKRTHRPLWRIVVPLLILLAEFAAISLYVELPKTAMTEFANAPMFSGGALAVVIFLLLASGTYRQSGRRIQRGPVEATFWACAHIVLFHAFLAATLRLDRMTDVEITTSDSVLWLVLAFSLAVSTFLPFVHLAALGDWVYHSTRLAVLALSMGLLLFSLTGPFRQLWPRVHWPATVVAQTLLEWSVGNAIPVSPDGQTPVIGVSRIHVLVTPQCSEMESILAFWLLGLALLIAKWRSLRVGRFALLALTGTVLLYFLNAVRLSALVLLGLQFSSDVCVNIAHSRLGGILFLALGIGWWIFTCGRCCIRDDCGDEAAAASRIS